MRHGEGIVHSKFGLVYDATGKAIVFRDEAGARHGRGVVLDGVEGHLHQALGAPIVGSEAPVREAQAAGDRGAYVRPIEVLALDLRVLDGFFCHRQQLRLGAKLEPQPLHPPEEAALLQMHLRERLGKGARVPAKMRPIGQFPDIHILLIL